MAVDYLLEIEGIKGESRIEKHKGEIEVLSYSWGATNAGSYQTGGGGSGKVSVQDFHFTKRIDKSSPVLLLSCASGKHIPKATLTVRKSGGDPHDYYIIKLTDILVSGIQGNGRNDALPTEQISMNYAKIEMTYFTQGSTAPINGVLVPDPLDPAGTP